MIKRLSLLFLAFALLVSVCGCGREKKPEDTVAAFQDAFNHYDIDSMLECVDPLMADTIRFLLNSEGENYSLNASLIFALIKIGFPLLPLLSDSISKDDLPKLTLECGESSENGDSASIPVDGTISLGKGNLSFHVTVNLERQDGVWFITGLNGKNNVTEEVPDPLRYVSAEPLWIGLTTFHA